MYNELDMDPENSPQSLQNKVQFDVRFFMCRRGNENFHDMRKDTFKVKKDAETGIQYVVKVVDELDKNHGDNQKDIVSG